MNDCKHFKKIGDNYGFTCDECGEVLEGYGFGGCFGSNLSGARRCLHVFSKISAEEEQCLYCEEIRERQRKAN